MLNTESDGDEGEEDVIYGYDWIQLSDFFRTEDFIFLIKNFQELNLRLRGFRGAGVGPDVGGVFNNKFLKLNI